MSIKLRKVFACDICGTKGLPLYGWDVYGPIRYLPKGWIEISKKEHLCPSCALEHEALKMALAKRNEKEKDDD